MQLTARILLVLAAVGAAVPPGFASRCACDLPTVASTHSKVASTHSKSDATARTPECSCCRPSAASTSCGQHRGEAAGEITPSCCGPTGCDCEDCPSNHPEPTRIAVDAESTKPVGGEYAIDISYAGSDSRAFSSTLFAAYRQARGANHRTPVRQLLDVWRL